MDILGYILEMAAFALVLAVVAKVLRDRAKKKPELPTPTPLTDWTKYPGLKTVSTLLTVVGGLTVVVSILGGVLAVSYFQSLTPPSESAQEIGTVASIGATLVGVVLGAIPWAMGDAMKVLVDIERNTRSNV